ncbi:MAG TPA: O-antigen ligase family protein [Longimicrobiales bacterium]|nr:O-antigen ligase family protein [Longimicrobiales bacterium]
MDVDSAGLPAPDTYAVPAPPRAPRLALHVLRLGAIVAVLVVVTWKQFELDRFFVPKELTLHVTALLAGLLALRAFRRTPFTRVDALLALYLLLGVVSAIFATNGWFAVRALTISASGIVIFWAARALRGEGYGWPILVALALAVVVAAATALLQTYGVRTDFFSLNRSPGGTLGNRNFVAHIAAFGLPIVLFVALGARRNAAFVLGLLGATLVAAVLVLTRSRAGWLAAGAALLTFAVAFVLSPALRRHRRSLARFAIMLLVAAAGIAAAVLAPNSLRWNTDSPYLESIRGVANYQEGSGRGRLVQYRQSLRMAAQHPLLGVGPGNWTVEYPDYAARRDPSLNGNEPGTTSNPWPSSDWIAFIAERGFIATLLLALALTGITIASFRRLRSAIASDEALGAAALIATLTAAVVAGIFDAVLLLALPTLFVWAALGALSPADDSRFVPSHDAGRTAMLFLVAMLGAGIGGVRSATQLVAMGIHANSESVTWLSRASRIDPGNYRLHIRLARSGSGLDRAARCNHARAARNLMPNAEEANRLARPCS